MTANVRSVQICASKSERTRVLQTISCDVRVSFIQVYPYGWDNRLPSSNRIVLLKMPLQVVGPTLRRCAARARTRQFHEARAPTHDVLLAAFD
jgi:hypothetical protein